MSDTNQPNSDQSEDAIDLKALAEAAREGEGSPAADHPSVDAITRPPNSPPPEEAEKLETLRDTVKEAHEVGTDNGEDQGEG